MAQVYLSLGSNLKNPLENIKTAKKYLEMYYKIIKESSYYDTEPIGGIPQSNFVNQVVSIDSHDTASMVLSRLQKIESIMGRKRTQKWGPRIIDIDILLYDRDIINTPYLVIPHTEMINRQFVLVPLLEIMEDILIPGKKNKLSYYVEKNKDQKIVKL
jgi:2-amino-4-hydroxy-6-hydroxymethyldihydropteridine diphosphokinase